MSVAAMKEAKRKVRELIAEQDAALFVKLLKRAGLPAPVRELVFDTGGRRWRFDFAWPSHKLALEIEGGVWTNGRHTRSAGFLEDIAKYNRAAVLGWRLLRCTPAGLQDLWTITQLTDALTHSEAPCSTTKAAPTVAASATPARPSPAQAPTKAAAATMPQASQ